MDYETEIDQLKAKIASFEKIILEISVPIIPSIIDNTIIIPISRHAGQDCFNLIRTRVLNYVGEHRATECAVLDFTEVGLNDVDEFDFTLLPLEISQLNSALKLMGVRPIFVGFNPRIAKEVVHIGIHKDIESYVNLKTSFKKLLSENEKSLYSFC